MENIATNYNTTTILTVSQLNHQIRLWLENEIDAITVIGEMSNVSKPQSGHVYFTLKDASAQLRCVYFRNYHAANITQFQDGQQVIATGKLSLYEARGDYQLLIHNLINTGWGNLYQQFANLKAKLLALGLFDQVLKRPLPPFPDVIGVITSINGAALHDILTTLASRYPLAAIKVYASEVQGKDAHLQLIAAIHKANTDNIAQVLILARGGGSIEDLWAFNDEQLAYVIRNSTIPIVSGVGHETDFTIADFVADLRAATPTAAAQATVPNYLEIAATIKTHEQLLIASLKRWIKQKQFLLSHYQSKLLSPQDIIDRYWQTLDLCQHKLQQHMRNCLNSKQHLLRLLYIRLHNKNYSIYLNQIKCKITHIEQQLRYHMQTMLAQSKKMLNTQLATLNAISPQATLNRGYAIAMLKQQIIYSSSQVQINDTITLQLAQGMLECVVQNQDS